MQIVQNGTPFSFNYTAYDQASSLDVAFSVFDITSGSAVFVRQIPAVYADFGVYSANFTGDSGKTYLVIGVVYTDGSYITVDTTRAPGADCYQVLGTFISTLAFNYTAFDQDPDLFVRATVYNMTSGTPAFVQTVSMAYAAFGVYFGLFTGLSLHTYDVASVVYTDNTFMTVDTSRAPACDNLNYVFLPPLIANIFQAAVLVGASTAAILEAIDG